MNRRSLFLWLLLFVTIGFIFYLSWIPSPEMHSVKIVPDAVGKWADQEKNLSLRTGVPFFVAGIICAVLLILNRPTLKGFIFVWLTLVLVAIIAEIGQFLLSSRQPDVFDVIWGAVGTLLGLAVPGVFLLWGGIRRHPSKTKHYRS